MVLTIPPPAYHRFTIAFPFLVILMTSRLSSAARSGAPAEHPLRPRRRPRPALRLCQPAPFAEAVFRDRSPDELRLSELINQRFDGRKLYVAAFDAFAFQKIFYFQDRGENRHVETGFHENLLQNVQPDEKYVYVMILPSDFREPFERPIPGALRPVLNATACSAIERTEAVRGDILRFE